MEIGHENMTSNTGINILSPHILSVQASLNGLSFCILDSSDNTILLLKEQRFTSPKNPLEVADVIKKEFQTNPLLQQTFKKATLLHDNNMCSFVPKTLFNADNAADYLKFNTKLFESDFIAHDEISAKELIAVYVPFININNYFIELFGSFEYQHSSAVLLENLLQNTNNNDEKIYCNITDCNVEIVFIKNGELHFFNSFQYTTVEDFSYYILFTLAQLQLNTETITLILLGDIGLDDDCYTALYTYVRHIVFGSRNTSFTFRDLEQKPKYGYSNYSLLNAL